MSEYYLESHEWARVEGDLVVVGLSPFAAGEVGEIIHIELPAVGDSLSKGEAMGEIESVKSVNDIYSPLDGEVIEINESLTDAPELVNNDALAAGWFLKVKASGSDITEGLMDVSAYEAHIRS